MVASSCRQLRLLLPSRAGVGVVDCWCRSACHRCSAPSPSCSVVVVVTVPRRHRRSLSLRAVPVSLWHVVVLSLTWHSLSLSCLVIDVAPCCCRMLLPWLAGTSLLLCLLVYSHEESKYKKMQLVIQKNNEYKKTYSGTLPYLLPVCRLSSALLGGAKGCGSKRQ